MSELKPEVDPSFCNYVYLVISLSKTLWFDTLKCFLCCCPQLWRLCSAQGLEECLHKGVLWAGMTLLCRLGQGRTQLELVHYSHLMGPSSGSSQARLWHTFRPTLYFPTLLRTWSNRTASRESFLILQWFPAPLSGKVRASLGNSFTFIVSPAGACLLGAWLTTDIWR